MLRNLDFLTNNTSDIIDGSRMILYFSDLRKRVIPNFETNKIIYA